MTEITIDISEVLKKLDPDKMQSAVKTALSGAADLIRADVKQYPPPPARSTYRRTGTLGRSWTKRIKHGARWPEAHIGTHVAYAPYVQDKQRQAWMHKGRWPAAQDVARQRSPDVVRLILQAVEKWAR